MKRFVHLKCSLAFFPLLNTQQVIWKSRLFKKKPVWIILSDNLYCASMLAKHFKLDHHRGAFLTRKSYQVLHIQRGPFKKDPEMS